MMHSCHATKLLRQLTRLGLLVLLCLCGPVRVYAQPSQHITLELSAPASCPNAQALLESVDAQLGADFSTDSELRAWVQVRELGPADYELQLRYRAGAGVEDERRLRGESCSAVTDAAVLLLAIALSPSVSIPVPEEPSQSFWAPRVGLTGAFDTALTRQASFGAGVAVGVRLGSFELYARAQLFFPPSTARAGTTTTWDSFSVDLEGCRPWELGRISLGPCVRAEVGRLSAGVAGPVEEQRPGAARFQALAIGAEVRVRLASPLSLALTADFAWFLRRPQFVVAELGEVGRPAKFGTRVYFGPLLAW